MSAFKDQQKKFKNILIYIYIYIHTVKSDADLTQTLRRPVVLKLLSKSLIFFVFIKISKVTIQKSLNLYFLLLINNFMATGLFLKLSQLITFYSDKWSEVWSDIRPSMVTHTQNLCSVFNPSIEHTQQWTHTRSSGQPFMLQRPLEQLGVRCLVQEHLSRGIDGGESTGYSLSPHQQTPAVLRFESATFQLRVRLSKH